MTTPHTNGIISGLMSLGFECVDDHFSEFNSLPLSADCRKAGNWRHRVASPSPLHEHGPLRIWL